MSNASAVEALLFAALELGSAAERAAYLDSACGGDAELRRQVERLLKAHAHVGDFLRKPVVERLAAAPEPGDATQETNDSPDGSDFTFLQPPARPDSLGRLGHYEV